jgi:hypothetical protein
MRWRNNEENAGKERTRKSWQETDTWQIKTRTLKRDSLPIQKEFQNPIFGELMQIPHHRLAASSCALTIIAKF